MDCVYDVTFTVINWMHHKLRLLPVRWPQEEAVSYYTNLEAQLKDDYRKEREKVNRKPLGMAFVTFQNEAITAM